MTDDEFMIVMRFLRRKRREVLGAQEAYLGYASRITEYKIALEPLLKEALGQ